MTILDILSNAGFATEAFIAFLRKLQQAAPDLAPTIEVKIAELNAAVSEQGIAALKEVLLVEIPNIAQGEIDPRDHPSDA